MSGQGNMSFQTPAAPPPRQRPAWLVWTLTLLGVLVVAGAVTGGVVWRFLATAPASPGEDVEILIPRGLSFSDLTARLKAKNAITSERGFLLLAHTLDLAGKVRSGRFVVNTGWTPRRVLDQLTSGKPLLDRITLPEGLTWREAGKKLEAGGFVNFADFDAVIHDPAFLRHWGIPFDSAEGFLFPDTYLIMRPLTLDRASAASVAGRLIDNFWRRTQAVWPDGRRPGPGDAPLVRRVVTLASIVEKETAVPGERRRVAGVYVNRLQKDMLLQADPTVIYGLGEAFTGDIRRSDLENADNPYNTYRRKGLPPGPICSPGLASIRAALNPEDHALLYFVARGDGSHTFSATLAQHNRAVRLYRESRRSGNTPALLPGGAPEPNPAPAPPTDPGPEKSPQQPS